MDERLKGGFFSHPSEQRSLVGDPGEEKPLGGRASGIDLLWFRHDRPEEPQVEQPSSVPAITSRGIMPLTSRVASMPPRATDSFQRSAPGKSMAWPRRNPAPPAIMIEGSSSEPCAATKLHKARDMS